MIARQSHPQRVSQGDRDAVWPHRLRWSGLCFLVVGLGLASAAIVPERAESDAAMRQQSLPEQVRRERRLTAGVSSAFDGREITLRDADTVERVDNALVLSGQPGAEKSLMVFDIARAPGGVPIGVKIRIDRPATRADHIIITLNRFQEGRARVHATFRLDMDSVRLHGITDGIAQSMSAANDGDAIDVSIVLPALAQGGPMSLVLKPTRTKQSDEKLRLVLRELTIGATTTGEQGE